MSSPSLIRLVLNFTNDFIVLSIPATQIGAVAEKLCQNLNIKVSVLTGGSTKRKMMNPVMEVTDILVGSIGSVSKLVTTKIYDMSRVQHVVLDEADTMLDDSFNSLLWHFLKKFPVCSLRPDLPKTIEQQPSISVLQKPPARFESR